MDYKKYSKFIKSRNFEIIPLITDKKGNTFFNKELVEDSNGKVVYDGNSFINIKYTSVFSLGRILSNLYPIEFKFRGKKAASIESVLQGIKYKDKRIQNLVLRYSTSDEYHTRACNQIDNWTKTQTLYWQGKPINRQHQEYQDFLDELYFSALKNPLYLRGLIASKGRYLLHHIGVLDSHFTVLTRHEYESRINTLRDFALQQLKKRKIKLK